MKSILIIDTPKDCGHCRISDFVDGDSCLCRKEDRKNNANEKPEWCPLKPMPEKYIEREIKIETERDVEVCTHGITLGRNLLIEEIEK